MNAQTPSTSERGHSPRHRVLGAMCRIDSHRARPRKYPLLLFAALTVVGHEGVASASDTTGVRTAPYDDGGAWTGCGPHSCEVSATSDKTTGHLHAAAAVESASVDQQLLWPASYRYWLAESHAGVSVAMAAGPGTTTWTARLRVNSAVVDAEASSGRVGAQLYVGFGIIDTAHPYAGAVASTTKALTSMSDGDVVLQLSVSLPAAGVYEAFVGVNAEAFVSNDGTQIATTPSIPLPCLISREGRGWTICVPPTVASQTAYGFADGHATSSIDASVDSVAVKSS